MLFYVITDMIHGIRYSTGDISSNSGTTHEAFSLEQSVAYIEEVFSNYKEQVGNGKFHGCVAEIGPGDNFGVGLLFLLEGCERIDLVDRYYSRRDQAKQSKIYDALSQKYPGIKSLYKDGIVTENNKEILPANLHRYYGESAAAEEFFGQHERDGRNRYDFIVSWVVLQHLYEPLRALEGMSSALNSGGMMLHRVDLRDLGLFSETHHELKFLEVPDWIYYRMTLKSGRPNRVLLNQYRSCLDKTGLEYEILVTRLAGVGSMHHPLPYADIPQELREKSLKYVRSVKNRLASSFRNVSDEDLSVAGIFIVARKTQ